MTDISRTNVMWYRASRQKYTYFLVHNNSTKLLLDDITTIF